MSRVQSPSLRDIRNLAFKTAEDEKIQREMTVRRQQLDPLIVAIQGKGVLDVTEATFLASDQLSKDAMFFNK
jgi:hypothetical protein